MTPAELNARGLWVKPLEWKTDRNGDLYSGQYEIVGPLKSERFIWRFKNDDWEVREMQLAAIAAANAHHAAQVAAMIEVIE